MSRLQAMIYRVTAQRDLLDHIADHLTLPEGPVLELGLGNGRTFSHLQTRFADRRLIAFDRTLGAHQGSHPDGDDLILGEISVTAEQFVGKNAALVHADIGKGYADKDAITLKWLPQLVAGLLAPGGIAVSGLPLVHANLQPLPMPASVENAYYFLYRRAV
jgi:trans-aconitate methyltransferase